MSGTVSVLLRPARCVGCGACLPACPERALRPTGGLLLPLRITASCTGCGDCVEICPVDAFDWAPGSAA